MKCLWNFLFITTILLFSNKVFANSNNKVENNSQFGFDVISEASQEIISEEVDNITNNTYNSRKCTIGFSNFWIRCILIIFNK